MHKIESTYYLYDTLLLSLDHFEYIGFTLQSNLRYNRHVQDIKAKVNCTLRLLWRYVRAWSPQLKERAYKALIQLQLEYPSQYCMVSLEKMDCGCYWESPVPFFPLHIQHIPSCLQCCIEICLAWLYVHVHFYKIFSNLCSSHPIWSNSIKPIPKATKRYSHQHKILPLSISKNAFKFSFFPRTMHTHMYARQE